MSQSPWHRHVSPIFFLLLVVAGLMLGFVAFFLLPEVAHGGRWVTTPSYRCSTG